MRLFTGIDLPESVAANLHVLLTRLGPLAPLRWSKVENLHITTKFIGEWPAGRLEELTGALGRMPPRNPFPISVDGLGWFPNPHRPRIFWAGVHAGPDLADLARQTELITRSLGIAAEERVFRPHLTLARIDSGRGPSPDLGPLRRAVAALDPAGFGTFECTRFHLYLSEMAPGGSRYTKLASFSLEVQ